jgi:hypothetical protein
MPACSRCPATLSLAASHRRAHVASAPADLELADHGGVSALQQLDDIVIGAAAGLDARDTWVRLAVGFAAMPDTANLNYVVARADEEEPVIAYP